MHFVLLQNVLVNGRRCEAVAPNCAVLNVPESSLHTQLQEDMSCRSCSVWSATRLLTLPASQPVFICTVVKARLNPGHTVDRLQYLSNPLAVFLLRALFAAARTALLVMTASAGP